MAEYAVRRVEAITRSLAGRSVLILGLSYRGDVREAAFTSAKLLQNALSERGAAVYIDDPLFGQDELRALGYIPFTPELEGEICAIILQTGHLVYQSLAFSRFERCLVVLDGRRVLCREKIESLGMRYIAIGDGGLRTQEGYRSESALASLTFGREGGE